VSGFFFGGTFSFLNCYIIGEDNGSLVLIGVDHVRGFMTLFDTHFYALKNCKNNIPKQHEQDDL
jgi:hypothetical protein